MIRSDVDGLEKCLPGLLALCYSFCSCLPGGHPEAGGAESTLLPCRVRSAHLRQCAYLFIHWHLLTDNGLMQNSVNGNLLYQKREDLLDLLLL